ncbi:uncharacterized protein LOC113673384 [Pocillopora damicornis]|nr:uncharacterized protein LOC113673384 [Pocillopora damicornis]
MTGIEDCGERAWTLVMKVHRTKNTFTYDSPQWDRKTPYQVIGDRTEYKLPGYWLNPFRKLCVSMKFQTGAKINMLMKVNISANSLYSLLHGGVSKTLTGSPFVIKPWTPQNINTSCLVRGFNIRDTQQGIMKSRVGVQSQTTNCNSPYIVRGVGIGLQGYSDVSCGEIHVNKDLSKKVFPATCAVYVQ